MSLGARIRAARTRSGLTQAAAARAAGISPSYLNLIEHGRRPIAGALLGKIAEALGEEVSALTRGPDPAALALLQTLAVEAGLDQAAADEFAMGSPEWSRILVNLKRHADSLADKVAALQDRAHHDPRLADALHEVLSTVTAIRASASILTGSEEVDPDWTRRFLRTIGEESDRLAAGADALSRHLEAETQVAIALIDDALADADAGLHPDMPGNVDPATLPQMPAALRRAGALRPLSGLAVCDASGGLIQVEPAPGFTPQGVCPLWPLYEALAAPGTPIRRIVEIAGAVPRRFQATAICETEGGIDGPPIRRATMLLEPGADPAAPAIPAGPGCRLCPRYGCRARREPSVLSTGTDAKAADRRRTDR